MALLSRCFRQQSDKFDEQHQHQHYINTKQADRLSILEKVLEAADNLIKYYDEVQEYPQATADLKAMNRFSTMSWCRLSHEHDETTCVPTVQWKELLYQFHEPVYEALKQTEDKP